MKRTEPPPTPSDITDAEVDMVKKFTHSTLDKHIAAQAHEAMSRVIEAYKGTPVVIATPRSGTHEMSFQIDTFALARLRKVAKAKQKRA